MAAQCPKRWTSQAAVKCTNKEINIETKWDKAKKQRVWHTQGRRL